MQSFPFILQSFCIFFTGAAKAMTEPFRHCLPSFHVSQLVLQQDAHYICKLLR